MVDRARHEFISRDAFASECFKLCVGHLAWTGIAWS